MGEKKGRGREEVEELEAEVGGVKRSRKEGERVEKVKRKGK